MDTYLVGGAVRDAELKLPISDRDWVVVGATPDDMLSAGYRQVGKDFPVFLHPHSHEEYALARTERKTGSGHHGFDVDTGLHITLEQDLSRRDLTINAMARAQDGTLVDPWGGRRDLEQRLLRHVSAAFVEDPLRVLRTARFAARFASFGFRVAPETLALMRHMVASGELGTLPAERVNQELVRALASASPRSFIEVLRDCDALDVLWPELEALFGTAQAATHQTALDCGEHTLLALDRAVDLEADAATRFATLCHDLGTGATRHTPPPQHDDGHEERGVSLTLASCKRLRVANDWRDLAVLTTRWHTHCQRAHEFEPDTLVDLLSALDVRRRPDRFEQFLSACEAIARAQPGRNDRAYSQPAYLRRAARAVDAVDAGALVEGTPPERRGQAIRSAQIAAVRRVGASAVGEDQRGD